MRYFLNAAHALLFKCSACATQMQRMRYSNAAHALLAFKIALLITTICEECSEIRVFLIPKVGNSKNVVPQTDGTVPGKHHTKVSKTKIHIDPLALCILKHSKCENRIQHNGLL